MTIRIAGEDVAGEGLQGGVLKPSKEVIACAVSYNECQGEFDDTVGFCRNLDGSLRFMGTLEADVDNIRITFSKGKNNNKSFNLKNHLKGPWSADVTTSYGDDESLTVNAVWFRGQAQAGRAWTDIVISTVDECQGDEGTGGCCCKEIIKRLDHLIQLAEERNNLLHILVYGDGEPVPENQELPDADEDSDSDGTPDMYDPEPDNPQVTGWNKKRGKSPEVDGEGNKQSFQDWYDAQDALWIPKIKIPEMDWFFDPFDIQELNYRLELTMPDTWQMNGTSYETGVGSYYYFDTIPHENSQDWIQSTLAYWRPILRDLVSVFFTFWIVMYCFNQTKTW